jgi:hypothetical protein
VPVLMSHIGVAVGLYVVSIRRCPRTSFNRLILSPFCQVVYKRRNIKAFNPIGDMPINPPLFQPLDTLLKITQVSFQRFRSVILALKGLLK